MEKDSAKLEGKVALVTGASRRIGKTIAERLHEAGMNIVLHYRKSQEEAEHLVHSLNCQRSKSAQALQADLPILPEIRRLAEQATARWGRLDVLVNNASVFCPGNIEAIDEAQWDQIIGTNLKGPLFLGRYLAAELRRRRGCIINMGDIHADRPLKGHMLYSISKAGVHMLTKSLARELAPEVRSNAVAPGALMWPEAEDNPQLQKEIISRTALMRAGSAQDAAAAVLFLVRDAGYITGQIISVDGGRTLSN